MECNATRQAVGVNETVFDSMAEVPLEADIMLPVWKECAVFIFCIWEKTAPAHRPAGNCGCEASTIRFPIPKSWI